MTIRGHQAIVILLAILAAAVREAQSGAVPDTPRTVKIDLQGLSSTGGHVGPHPSSNRRLHQAGGCIQWVPDGCPSAYPAPSCCTPGPAGPSRCAPFAATCPNKYCC